MVTNETKNRNIATKWSSFGPYLLSALRIMSAFMLIPAGTMKLFAFPAGMPPDGSTAPMMSQIWIGGVLEVFGGALRWSRFDGHECCLNNKRHNYEKERTEFIIASYKTRPTQV